MAAICLAEISDIKGMASLTLPPFAASVELGQVKVGSAGCGGVNATEVREPVGPLQRTSDKV